MAVMTSSKKYMDPKKIQRSNRSEIQLLFERCIFFGSVYFFQSTNEVRMKKSTHPTYSIIMHYQ